jgi:hypothetical protein
LTKKDKVRKVGGGKKDDLELAFDEDQTFSDIDTHSKASVEMETQTDLVMMSPSSQVYFE